MEITEVRIFFADEDRLKAYVTVTFDRCFVVRDLKIINGNSGLFVAMPSKKKKDGSYRDIAHPIHSDFRQEIETIILNKYKEELQSQELTGKKPTANSEQEYEKALETLSIERVETQPRQARVLPQYREAESGIGPNVKK